MCIMREQTKSTVWRCCVVVFLETDGAQSYDGNHLHKILTIHVITINECWWLDKSIRLKGILAYQKLFLYKGLNPRSKVFHTLGQIVLIHFAMRELPSYHTYYVLF